MSVEQPRTAGKDVEFFNTFWLVEIPRLEIQPATLCPTQIFHRHQLLVYRNVIPFFLFVLFILLF